MVRLQSSLQTVEGSASHTCEQRSFLEFVRSALPAVGQLVRNDPPVHPVLRGRSGELLAR